MSQMSVPVSQYEALRAEMRDLRQKTEQVQQLATQVIGKTSIHDQAKGIEKDKLLNMTSHINHILQEEDGRTNMSVSSEPLTYNSADKAQALYHGTWPDARTMWRSDPCNIGPEAETLSEQDHRSVMSFASSSGGAPLERIHEKTAAAGAGSSSPHNQQLEAKVDMVYSLLTMLGDQDHTDMGDTLLALSSSPHSCQAMRQAGCIPLLVQLVISDRDAETRSKASQALHNLVYSHSDEKTQKRERRVLKLLDNTRIFIEGIKEHRSKKLITPDDLYEGQVQIAAHLMKLSFEESYRRAISQLGGIHIIARLVETEHTLNGNSTNEANITMLRYACMSLINLTFGESGNKTLLCSFREFMRHLVVQLQSENDELRQVTASVLRNLSWRADGSSKEILREVGTVSGLMKAAIVKTNRENTLKSILSALWNLSGHSIENKSEICAVDGALGFLVDMLLPERSLAIVENAGGILRNISNQIAMREDYREILRAHNCLQILVDQLKCSSLTIVSNACGTLWNLSAKNAKDQETLRHIRAPEMLVILTKSKHKTIATASTAALKNLDSSRLGVKMFTPLDSTAKNMDLPALPSLMARKQKASLLAAEIDQNISETFENIERDSPTKVTAPKVFSDIPFLTRKHLKSPDCDRLVSDLTALTLSGTSGCSSSLPYAINSPTTFLPEETDANEKSHEHPTAEATSPTFGIYTETDLDQPTDYSLRYAEDDSDSETCDKLEKEFPPEDTLKTYCTEGTPYDNTPFNFSTATSMSDLTKLPKSQPNAVKVDLKAEALNYLVSSSPKETSTKVSTEGENKTTDKVASQFSSGLLSPEKPINYCEEGTPGYFSRVSSFGSLNDAEKLLPVQEDIQDGQITDTVCRLPEDIANEGKIKEEETLKYNKTTTATIESKAVKFDNSVNYAEETPLMFSPSSSLASLDSVEQHSIHDDRSSIISDLSRLTSGIVSPSELPDSPSQTVPPSPRPRKFIPTGGSTGLRYGGHKNAPSCAHPTGSSKHAINGANLRTPSSHKSSGIFEDKLIKFIEESTPVQFSTTTSLSSLTIDDHEPIVGDVGNCTTDLESSNNPNVSIEKHDELQEKCESTDNVNEEESESDDDNNILENCINIGMQKNRHSTTVADVPVPKLFIQNTPRPSSTGIPIPKSATTTRYIKLDTANEERKWQPSRTIHTNTSRIAQGCDIMHTYCTEDTPAILSHEGSNSDLSVLSINTAEKSQTPTTSKPDYLSDDSSNMSDSGQNDSMLADCIRDGMAARQAKAKPSQSDDVANDVQINTSPDKLYVNVAELKSGKVEYSSDDSSNLPGDDNLLADCIRAGQQRSVVRASIDSSKGNVLQATSTPIKPFIIREPGHSVPEPSDSRSLNQNEVRDESLSSLSLESGGSDDALLEQCILSGMAKTKEKPVGVATKHFNTQTQLAQGKATGKYSSSSHSKNGSAASVAYLQITQANTEKTIAADENSEKVNTQPASRPIRRNPIDVKSLDRCSPIEGNSSIKPQKNGYKIEAYCCQVEQNNLASNSFEEPLHDVIVNFPDEDDGFDSCDGGTSMQDKSSLSTTSGMNTVKSNTTAYQTIRNDRTSPSKPTATVDNRMLDPDAMIESLDRFTAELVSQSCHLHNNDLYASTNTETRSSVDTWHDDNSPNDATFPSISGSAPNVITFDSEHKPLNSISNGVEDAENVPNNYPTITMTESTMIQMEIAKMANVFQDAMANSFTSTNSLELDKIQPPSLMNSMADFSLTKSPQLQRKKSLPNSIILRRALSNHNATNGQVLDQKSISANNLDQLPVENILRSVDLESSMLSVASLSSEVADLKPDFLMNETVNPIFHNSFPIQCGSSVNSVTDLEHINPPSLFNELISDSLADVNTEFEDCCTHFGQCDVSVTEFSDANSVTPIQSDLSSASDDSISKKTKTLSKQLTPRQRRNLTKERYKTYTIAAEMILSDGVVPTADIPIPTIKPTPAPRPGRLSARERRQNDPGRFQTQTVQQPVLDALVSTTGTNRLQRTSKMSDVPPKSRICIFRKDNSRDRGESIPPQQQTSTYNDDIDPELKYRTYNVRSSKLPINTEEEQLLEKPKAKILKPENVERELEEAAEEEGQGKGIRGKRKPLYTKSKPTTANKPTVRNIKMVSSNLVKNVTSTLKSTVQKNPMSIRNLTQQKLSNSTSSVSKALPTARKVSPTTNDTSDKPPTMERQGTFTKSDMLKPASVSANSLLTVKSRIARAIQPAGSSKLPTPPTSTKPPIKATKSAQTSPRRAFDRSLSANGRDKILSAPPTSMRTSNSVQSLRSTSAKPTASTKIPGTTPTAGGAPPSTKQITSKIASLWRRVEESKKQTSTGYSKPDKRIWLEGAGSSANEFIPSSNGTAASSTSAFLMRSRTFESGEAAQQKRVSRLGSFVVADCQDGDDVSSASDVF